jgi:hypothetical protein
VSMIPILLKRYELPPQCSMFVVGTDVQSDLGQQVLCSRSATVRVQIEEEGNTVNLCEEHYRLFDGRVDWRVK